MRFLNQLLVTWIEIDSESHSIGNIDSINIRCTVGLVNMSDAGYDNHTLQPRVQEERELMDETQILKSKAIPCSVLFQRWLIHRNNKSTGNVLVSAMSNWWINLSHRWNTNEHGTYMYLLDRLNHSFTNFVPKAVSILENLPIQRYESFLKPFAWVKISNSWEAEYMYIKDFILSMKKNSRFRRRYHAMLMRSLLAMVLKRLPQ